MNKHCAKVMGHPFLYNLLGKWESYLWTVNLEYPNTANAVKASRGTLSVIDWPPYSMGTP